MYVYMYQHVESLFPKAANCKDYQSEVTFVLDFYRSDLNEFSLTTPFEVSSTMYMQTRSQEVYKLRNMVKLFKTLIPILKQS